MIPILFGMIAAALFGIGVAAIYGLDALVRYPWVGGTLLGILLATSLIALVNLAGEHLRCFSCGLAKQYPELAWLCRSAAPCAE